MIWLPWAYSSTFFVETVPATPLASRQSSAKSGLSDGAGVSSVPDSMRLRTRALNQVLASRPHSAILSSAPEANPRKNACRTKVGFDPLAWTDQS
jgi:hypothetical protein